MTTTTTTTTNLLPPSIANRVAAIAAFLTALAAAVTGSINVLPQAWQSTVLAGLGVVGAIVTCLHFMLGAQKSEQVQAQLAIAKHNASTAAVVAHLETRNQELLASNDQLAAMLSPVVTADSNPLYTFGPDGKSFPPIDESENAFEEAEQDINSDYTPQYAGHPDSVVTT